MADPADQWLCVIPWHDGTQRVVPVGTALALTRGDLVFADVAGFQWSRSEVGAGVPFKWHSGTVSAVLMMGPEPPLLPEPVLLYQWTISRTFDTEAGGSDE